MNTFREDLWVVLHNYYLAFVKMLPRLALGLIVLLLTFFIASQIRKLIQTRLLRHTSDSLLTGFLAQLSYWILLIIGLSVFLGTIGLDGAVTKILAGAGISAFILGFALKDIGENFLAGILLAFKRPFKIGDLVETQGVHGRIIGLNLRETIIKTLDGKDVYVPNGGILKNPLYNYSVDNYLRLDFTVHLDNGENQDQALQLIRKTLSHTPGVLKEEHHMPGVNIEETKGHELVVKVCFWIKSPESETIAPEIKTKAIQNVLNALKSKGFSYVPPASDTAKEQA